MFRNLHYVGCSILQNGHIFSDITEHIIQEIYHLQFHRNNIYVSVFVMLRTKLIMEE